MPIRYLDWITRDMLRASPEARFVFGDNVQRVGLGGQAGAMRGEPNGIGVATKWAPGMAASDFFSDGPGCFRVVSRDLDAVQQALDEGRTVYVPKDGPGTGLSELPTRAPKLLALIEDWFTRRYSGPRVWNIREPGVPVDAVCCGRAVRGRPASPYANPFRIGRDGDRDQVCDRFECEALPALDVSELRGKDLLCFCAPARCHCDSILRKANS